MGAAVIALGAVELPSFPARSIVTVANLWRRDRQARCPFGLAAWVDRALTLPLNPLG